MQTKFTEEQLRDPDNFANEKVFKKCVHCGMCNATCPTHQLLGDELDLKKMANDFGGYLTVIKTSSEYDYGEPIFTVDKVRLMISEKVKKSFDPKRILNPGKMYRGV